jgi:uncharacterized protein YfeS
LLYFLYQKTKGVKMISKDEKSKKVQQAELKLAQAKAQLAKAKRVELCVALMKKASGYPNRKSAPDR